jgi:hypothetical protein
MRMDSYTPVIIIEGFLAFGVVLLLYYLHAREMRQIRAKKAQHEREEALAAQEAGSANEGSIPRKSSTNLRAKPAPPSQT